MSIQTFFMRFASGDCYNPALQCYILIFMQYKNDSDVLGYFLLVVVNFHFSL